MRIYSFEATGNGNYDVEAGLEYNKHGRAITTALGYNQLLATNSVEVVAESGDHFVAHLRAAAEQTADGPAGVRRENRNFAPHDCFHPERSGCLGPA